MLTLYGIKTCGTCRKAVKDIENAGKSVEFRDIRVVPLDPATLRKFAARFGDDLINRRSTTWRGLSENHRKGVPEALIAAHPTLMKRPVIEDGDNLTLGWDASSRARHLG